MTIKLPSTICALLFLLIAHPSQAADWDRQQTAVWELVSQSWVDDTAGIGKWPGNYVDEDARSWNAGWPVPRDKASIAKWSRFGAQNSKVLQYELFPLAIVIKNDTAVVHYSVVSVTENHEQKRKRDQTGNIETLVKDGKNWKFVSLTSFDKGTKD